MVRQSLQRVALSGHAGPAAERGSGWPSPAGTTLLGRCFVFNNFLGSFRITGVRRGGNAEGRRPKSGVGLQADCGDERIKRVSDTMSTRGRAGLRFVNLEAIEKRENSDGAVENYSNKRFFSPTGATWADRPRELAGDAAKTGAA